MKSFDQQPDSYSHRYTICPVQPVLFYRPVQQLDGVQRSNCSFDSSYKFELKPQKEKFAMSVKIFVLFFNRSYMKICDTLVDY